MGCNKGDKGNDGVRPWWLAKEVAHQHTDTFFAATPPLEALRLILSEAATAGPPSGVSRCGGPGRGAVLLDANTAICTHWPCGMSALACRRSARGLAVAVG